MKALWYVSICTNSITCQGVCWKLLPSNKCGDLDTHLLRVFFVSGPFLLTTDSRKSSPDCLSTVSESVFSVDLKTQVWTSSCWCTHDDVDLCTQLIVCCQAVHTLCGHLLGQHINSPKILAPRKLQDTSKIAHNVFTYPLSVSSDFVVYYICKLGCY